MLEFRILGPVEVLDGDRPIRLGGPKQRATLAILVLSANRVVSVERLADDLYAGDPPVTAVTGVQRQVSDLRKLLGADAIETRTPGYLLRVERDLLDLGRFERLTSEGDRALERSDPETAAALLEQALGLWRGAALADLAYEPFAQAAIGRLEELRLAALERRLEAELALGRHGAVLAELEALVFDHPLRERLRGLLILALYRAGRQAEALDVFRKGREALVAELGIEPSRALVELERQILTHDPALDLPDRAEAPTERTVLVVSADAGRFDALLAVAAPVVSLPDRALIVTHLLHGESEVRAAAAALNARCAALPVAARGAAFTSGELARDVVRLATSYDVELVLLDAAGELVARDLAVIAERSPATLAVLSGPAPDWNGGGVFVPFGGATDDWAALELGAWLATSVSVPLYLVGTRADPRRGRRDASRLLADASLAAQRVVGVAAEPLLVEPSEDSLLAALAPASIVVAGLPARWRDEGVGRLGAVLCRPGGPPALLVHGGTRPGCLAPRESRTRFSWSLEP